MMDSIVNNAVAAEYSPFSLLTTMANNSSDAANLNNKLALTQPEQFKLNELLQADATMTAPLSEDQEYRVSLSAVVPFSQEDR